jgi:hypothetical protein
MMIAMNVFSVVIVIIIGTMTGLVGLIGLSIRFHATPPVLMIRRSSTHQPGSWRGHPAHGLLDPALLYGTAAMGALPPDRSSA